MTENKCSKCKIIQSFEYEYPTVFWGKDIKGFVRVGGGTISDCTEASPVHNLQLIDGQLSRLEALDRVEKDENTDKKRNSDPWD